MTMPYGERPSQFSPAEWDARIQLADCYRLFDYFDWTDAIFNHISLRVPGTDGQYLVNPFGLMYDEVTPANLLKVDIEGNLVEPSDYPANRAGFALHGVIHQNRPETHCVIHSHTKALSAIGMKRGGLGHDDFYGAQLYGRVGYHPFEGITLRADEAARILQSLGSKDALVLQNHGVAVCGRTVAQAFFCHYLLQRAAEIQCLAAALPGPTLTLPDAIRQTCVDLSDDMAVNDHIIEKMFAGLVRKMNRSSRVSAAV